MSVSRNLSKLFIIVWASRFLWAAYINHISPTRQEGLWQ